MTNYTLTRNLGRAGQSLADGQVATSTGAILTSDASLYTQIHSACFFNTNAATQTLNIYITRNGGTRRQLYRSSLAQYSTFCLVGSGETLSLSPGDVLEADTTTGSAVDYFLSGTTEDA